MLRNFIAPNNDTLKKKLSNYQHSHSSDVNKIPECSSGSSNPDLLCFMQMMLSVSFGWTAVTLVFN